jgi:alpha-L-fucosidase
MFIDIVSKNGNLLLNVGPMADGTIPEIQRNLLLQFGQWLDVNGEGLFDTRPWIRAESQTLDALEIRFTQKGNLLYAFLLGKLSDKKITIKSLKLDKMANIQLLGHTEKLKWEQIGENLTIILPSNIPDAPAYGFKIDPKPEVPISK